MNPKHPNHISSDPDPQTHRLPVAPEHWRDYWRDHPATADEEKVAAVLKRHFDPGLIFCAGPYFFFVIEGGQDLKIKYIRGNFEQVCGHPREQFVGQHLLEMHRLMIPPQDSPILWGFSQFCHDFLSETPPDKRHQIKFSFYLNILHPSGRLVPVIQQDSIFVNSDGIPEYCFSFVTDISHLKDKNELMFSLLAIDEQGNQEFKCFSPKQLQTEQRTLLTVRERQIIGGLAEGLSSKQIAADLGIAFHTVNTHRQNMLAKTGCKSSAELVSYALGHALL